MTRFLPFLIIIVVILAVAAAAKVLLPGLVAKKGGGKGRGALPYVKQDALFTEAERSFLGVLESALGTDLRVFGKVRLADVIKVKPGLPNGPQQQAFNRIKAKHLDFVVCRPDDLAVEFVVELDDASHNRQDRKDRDAFLDEALAAAGVPIFRFTAKRAYAVGEVREALFEAASDTTGGDRDAA